MADEQKGDASSNAVKVVSAHEMTEAGKYFYDMFCAARAESRATAEGREKVTEFIELGKEQGDKMTKIMEDVAQGALTG